MPRTKGAAQLVDARPLLERISVLEERVTTLAEGLATATRILDAITSSAPSSAPSSAKRARMRAAPKKD